MYFEYDGLSYDFNITSQDELNILVKYFESSSKNQQITIEFYLDFDYGDSCLDEIQKAYQVIDTGVSYIYVNNSPFFMLIK